MPLLRAFAVGESRVQDRHFAAENVMQVGGYGRSKADLRNQENG